MSVRALGPHHTTAHCAGPEWATVTVSLYFPEAHGRELEWSSGGVRCRGPVWSLMPAPPLPELPSLGAASSWTQPLSPLVMGPKSVGHRAGLSGRASPEAPWQQAWPLASIPNSYQET